MTRRLRTSTLAALCALAATAGCGGGGGGGGSAPVTTPTVAPTATPTPTPLGALVFDGANGAPLAGLTLAGTGTANAQTFVAARSGDTGTFRESDDCAKANVAGVVPASAAGPQATFTVTPLGAGKCTVTITAADGASVALPVGVTTTEFPVQ